jgi:hypothetical protein
MPPAAATDRTKKARAPLAVLDSPNSSSSHVILQAPASMRSSSSPSSSVDPWLGLREDATAASHQVVFLSCIPTRLRIFIHLHRSAVNFTFPSLAIGARLFLVV